MKINYKKITAIATSVLMTGMTVGTAMAAGVSNTLWSMNDIVALIDAKEATKDRSRGRYKTKTR